MRFVAPLSDEHRSRKDKDVASCLASVCWSIGRSVVPSVCLFVRRSVCLSVCPFVRSSSQNIRTVRPRTTAWESLERFEHTCPRHGTRDFERLFLFGTFFFRFLLSCLAFCFSLVSLKTKRVLLSYTVPYSYSTPSTHEPTSC